MKKILFLAILILAFCSVPAFAEGRFPIITNTTLTSADTEYSQSIAGARYVEFQCRTSFAVRFAYEADKVATPTAPYMTLKAGAYYWVPVDATSATTLFFASSEAGVIVEMLIYK